MTYPNDIAFFNYFRAATLDTTFITKFQLYKRAVLTGIRVLTPEIRSYLAKKNGQRILINFGWLVGNFLNPFIHPLLGMLRRGRRFMLLVSEDRKYLISKILEKI
jgi:hypothetical protein